MGHKNINRLWLAAVAALLCVLPSSAVIRHTAVFDTSGVTVTPTLSGEDSVCSLSWPEMLPDGIPGAPELAGRQLRFIVPANAASFRVSVKGMADGRSISLPCILAPVQQPVPLNDVDRMTPTPADMSLYTHITPSVKIADEGYADGDNHVLTLWVVPMDYDPERNKVTCYGSLDIEIEYDMVAGLPSSQRPLTPSVQTTLSADWRKDIANSADISRYGTARTATEVKVPGYLIITSADLMDSFRELADWKRQKGYRVTQTCIDDILSDPAYEKGDTVTGVNDDAGKMRAYLMDYYRQNGKSFVLFGGDYTKVPIRYGYFDSDIGPVPSDWYFTELNSNWDSNGNNIFGEVSYLDGNDRNDYLSSDSELITGRLLCFKPAHVENYIKKLIRYETNPGNGNVDYLNNTFHFMYPGVNGCIPDFTKYWQVSIDTLQGLDGDDSNAPYPTGTQVMDAMTLKPYGYISMNGHGKPGQIASSECNASWHRMFGIQIIGDYDLEGFSDAAFNSFHTGMDRLTNYDAPSIAYTIACDVAPFDRMDTCGYHYSKDSYYPQEFNMASGFTCAGDWGGPAFIGNTRVGLNGSSQCVHSAFIRSIVKDPIIGKSQIVSKTNNWENSYYRFLCLTNHLIGDPEFQMWVGAPKLFNPSVTFGDDKITLRSTALNSCTVGIWDGANSYSRLILDSEIEFSTAGYENKSIFITKKGFLPISLFCGSGDNLISTFPNLNLHYAALGMDKNRKFVVKDGGKLNLSVKKETRIGSGLEIGSGGEVTIVCDGEVTINGGTILKGGKLTIRAKNTTINRSFTVEQGASVIIEKL